MTIILNKDIQAFAGKGSHEIQFNYVLTDGETPPASRLEVTFKQGEEEIKGSFRAYYGTNGRGAFRFAFPTFGNSRSNLNKPITVTVGSDSMTINQIANPTLTLYGGLSEEETYSVNTVIDEDRILQLGKVGIIQLNDNDYYVKGVLSFDNSKETDSINWVRLKLFDRGTKTLIADSERIYNDYLWDPKARNFVCCFDMPQQFQENMLLEVVYYTQKKYLGHQMYYLTKGW